MRPAARVAGAAIALILSVGSGAAAEQPGAGLDAVIAEASASAGVPQAWLRAVIGAESGGDPLAVSRAGAMGLMQLMPGTWREQRIRLGLGNDPFNVRDNLLAGAHYLRQMWDLYGPEGFLAAYNAGPGRYEEHLRGRPLPPETRAYVARLAPVLGPDFPIGAKPGPQALSWTHSPLFPDLAAVAEE